MTTSFRATPAFDDLESRIRTLLPELYQDCYNEVQPVSMGSAGLKYAADGRVAWDEIWGSFCDLAMAGGPPHRGTLLEPGTAQEIAANLDRYQAAVQEICRGISLVTGLSAEQSHVPGWVRVYCNTDAMAGWLARAINTENVSARFEGHILSLPAGPAYRIEKEIKNVITALAKTCHYWVEHTSPSQQQAIANLFVRMELESPLICPADREHEDDPRLANEMTTPLAQKIGGATSSHQYIGWLGLDYRETTLAIQMMRFLLAGNLLSRREGTTVFLPVNPESDPLGKRALYVLDQAHYRLARHSEESPTQP